MPITPKPLVETDVVSTRFPKDVLVALDAYCKYLGGASDRAYVIIEAVRRAIASDRRYQRSLRSSAPASTREKGSDGRHAATAHGPGSRPAAGSDPKPHGAA